jgi:hypothetical protein
MDPRQELEELRRLEDLERRLASQDLGEVRKQREAAQASAYYNTGRQKSLSDLIAPKQTDVSQLGAFERGLGGAKVAWDRAALGLKGMFTDLTPEDKALLEQGKAFTNQGGTAATVGNIAADAAMMAAPAIRGQQAIMAVGQMLPKAAQFVAGRLPSAALASGATSAAFAPEDRVGAFYGGAAGGAAGEVAGRVLTRALGGVVSDKVTPAARELMDQGANVPMWKAVDDTTRSGRVLRNAAERAKVLPVAGDMIRGQERSAIESWNRILMREATPPTPVLNDAGQVLRFEYDKPVTAVGSEGLQELSKRFNDAYGALYGSRGVPVDQTFVSQLKGIVGDAKAYMPGVADDVAGAVRRAEDTLMGLTSPTVTRQGGQTVGKGIVSSRIKTPVTQTVELGREVVPHTNVKTALDDINNAITAAYKSGNGEKAEALSAVRSAIESLRARGLPPEVAAQADEINKAYAKFKTLSRASSMLGAQKQGGVVTPGQQLNAIRARDKTLDKAAFSRGTAPGQQQALTAQLVYGNQLPDVGPGTAEKLLPFVGMGLPMLGMDAGATALLGTQTGQNLLMGKYGLQGGVRQYSPYLIEALRNYGAAVGND